MSKSMFKQVQIHLNLPEPAGHIQTGQYIHGRPPAPLKQIQILPSYQNRSYSHHYWFIQTSTLVEFANTAFAYFSNPHFKKERKTS